MVWQNVLDMACVLLAVLGATKSHPTHLPDDGHV